MKEFTLIIIAITAGLVFITERVLIRAMMEPPISVNVTYTLPQTLNAPDGRVIEQEFLPSTELGVAAHQPAPDSFLDRLLDAIEQVESGGRADPVGDSGQAVGSFQLWPVYVDDANRIAGTKYTYDDRWCPVKSREMTRIVLEHYGKGMPKDKWAVIHISPSKCMDWNRPAAVEYLRKINENF